MDLYYPLYPVFAFLSFILCLIPLPWHWQAWNAGTCAFMIWTAAVCLVEFINALIWQGNVDNFAPVWCDISECQLSFHPFVLLIIAFVCSRSNHSRIRHRCECISTLHKS